MALSYHYYYFFLSLVNGTDRYCVHTVALEVYAIPPGVWKARRSARAFGAASVRPSALWLSSAAGGSAGLPSSPLTFTSRRKETLPFSWVPTTPSQSATDPRGASVRHTDATHNVCNTRIHRHANASSVFSLEDTSRRVESFLSRAQAQTMYVPEVYIRPQPLSPWPLQITHICSPL